MDDDLSPTTDPDPRAPAGAGYPDAVTGPVGGPATQESAGVLRRLRRAQLAALGDDPTRRPPVVDGYVTGRLLGAGGSSVVWSGTGVDGVERALKVLQPDESGPADGAAGVLRELTVLRRVRHPRVVAVHDISRDGDGNPVLVLDLAPGGSLADVLTARRRLTVAEVTGLLAVLGPALEELHSAGVVHGDLAPGNVLLDARGEPLLADLGVSRALGQAHGSVMGTPGYADPAALAGAGVTAASDVHGLAAVAWCALTGAPPQAGGAVLSRFATRRAGADLPTGTSADLLAVLREGLHRKPSRRPTPGELAAAAVACATPRPVRAREVGTPARTSARTPAQAPDVPREVTVHLPGTPAPLPASVRPTPPAPRGRRRPSRRVLLPAAAVAVPVAVLAGVLLLRGTTPADAGTPAPAAAPSTATSAPVAPVPTDVVLAGDDAAAVVAELATRRAHALSAADPVALTTVDVAQSPALAADVAVLDGMADLGLRFADLAFEVRAVQVEEQDPFRLVVRADVVTGAHELHGADGTVTPVAATAPRTSRLTLVRVGQEWRISEVGG